MTHAPTEANAANLAPSFLQEVRARYAGTRLGRQELDGALLDEEESALWSMAQLEAGRVSEVPDLDRIVVAVDPPVTGHSASDECRHRRGGRGDARPAAGMEGLCSGGRHGERSGSDGLGARRA